MTHLYSYVVYPAQQGISGGGGGDGDDREHTPNRSCRKQLFY